MRFCSSVSYAVKNWGEVKRSREDLVILHMWLSLELQTICTEVRFRQHFKSNLMDHTKKKISERVEFEHQDLQGERRLCAFCNPSCRR